MSTDCEDGLRGSATCAPSECVARGESAISSEIARLKRARELYSTADADHTADDPGQGECNRRLESQRIRSNLQIKLCSVPCRMDNGSGNSLNALSFCYCCGSKVNGHEIRSRGNLRVQRP